MSKLTIPLQAPVLKEQRAEYDRMRAECDTLTSQLTRTMEEHAQAQQRAEAYRVDAEAATRESATAAQQLHDLGRQVRILTKEIARRDDPLIVERSTSEMDEDEEADVSIDLDDPEEVLQAHLVTFKSISELQSKNQQLIKIARSLAQQLNLDHEARIEDETREANEAVEEAHEVILQLKDDLDSAQVRVEALTRERDMFRRMLGQQPGSGAGGSGHVNGLGSAGGAGSAGAEAVRDLADVQAQFEAYKVEIGADSKRIREELQSTRAQLGQVQVALAKANAQIEYKNGELAGRNSWWDGGLTALLQNATVSSTTRPRCRQSRARRRRLGLSSCKKKSPAARSCCTRPTRLSPIGRASSAS